MINKEQNFWLYDGGKLVETTDNSQVFIFGVKDGKVGFDHKRNKWFTNYSLTGVTVFVSKDDKNNAQQFAERLNDDKVVWFNRAENAYCSFYLKDFSKEVLAELRKR